MAKKQQQEEDNLLKYELRVAGRSYDEDLAVQYPFEVNPNGLNRALVETPGMFAHWATLEVYARDEVAELEEALTVKEAELTEHYEQQLVTDKVTLIRQAVKKDPGRTELADRMREARRTLGLIRVGVSTMEKRLDAVFEAARNMRSEMDISSKPRSVKDRARDAEQRLNESGLFKQDS